MAPKIERVTESVVLGEGPHWDAATQTLYHVDVYGNNIVRYTPSTNKYAKASVAPKKPSFIVPIEGKSDHFVVSLNNELTMVKWDGESEAVIVENICCLDSVIPGIRINDAKCDSDGRLWAGTIGEYQESSGDFPPCGTLYTIDSQRQVKGHIEGLRIANGLTWNHETGKMFYIDSMKRCVDQYDFNKCAGTICNETVWFSLEKHSIPGIPDGMTIDTDGNLWVALFNGHQVIKIDGKHPETLLEVIEMPTKQVTSLTFGGVNLDELYVTTGAIEWAGEKPLPPVNGATYRITGTGSRGFPGVSFKLDC